MNRVQAMFQSTPPASYAIARSTPLLLPLSSSDRRTLTIRSERLIAIDIPVGTSVSFTARFAVWKLGTATVAAMDPVSYSFTATTGNTRVIYKPLPGYLYLDIAPSATISADVTLTISDVVPVGFDVDPDYVPVPIADLPTTPAGLETLGDFFDGAFLNQFEVQRADGGYWRTDLAERIGEFTILNNGSKRTVQYRGVTYQVRYVLPTVSVAVDGSNDGNDPALPRLTVGDISGTPTFLVLESGYLFSAGEGLAGTSPTNLIIVASQPGVPAILSGFVLRDTDVSGIWTGNNPYSSTDAAFTAPVELNMVQYDDLDDFGRPRLIAFNAHSAAIPGSTRVNSGTRELSRFSDQSAAPNRAFFYANSSANKIDNGCRTTLCRDIEFWGGSNPLQINQNSVLPISATFHRCAFRFAPGKFTSATACEGRDCLALEGNIYGYLVECAATDSLGDGFDGRGIGTADTANLCHVLEDRVIGRYCGLHPNDNRKNNQASTGHTSTRMLRIGSDYSFTGGACVQDARASTLSNMDLDSHTAMFGCFAYASQATPSTWNSCLFVGTETSDICRAWLLEFTMADRFGGSPAPAGKRIQLYNECLCFYDRNYSQGNSGSVDVILRGSNNGRGKPILAIPRPNP